MKTRHYGVLCLGWPGVNPKTFSPGETIRCRYRVRIHRGTPDVAYEDFRSHQLDRAMLKVLRAH